MFSLQEKEHTGNPNEPIGAANWHDRGIPATTRLHLTSTNQKNSLQVQQHPENPNEPIGTANWHDRGIPGTTTIYFTTSNRKVFLYRHNI